MTDETQVETPVEDAPLSTPLVESADSSAAPEGNTDPVAKEADDAGNPRDEEGKFLSPKAQKRIDELTWKAHQREREAEYWRNLALQAQPQPQKEPEPVSEKLPSLEEFGYDEAKYQAALIQYATQKAESVVEKRLSQAEQQRAEQQRMGTFAERQREFAKSVPDFEERVLKDPTLPITAAMRDVIVDSESGPEIAYYLATNRELADRIARLPAHMAALEMGRIEGRLSAQKVVAKKPVTQAPPPPPIIEAVEPEVSKDPDAMSMDEWIKWREKQLRRKRN